MGPKRTFDPLRRWCGPLLLLAVASGCAGGAAVAPSVVKYRGETIPIRPVPGIASPGVAWPVSAFVRGDSTARGYLDAEEPARRELAGAPGIRFVGPGRWSEVEVDWVGLHILSHSGYFLQPGLPPEAHAAPEIPDGLAHAVREDGVTSVRDRNPVRRRDTLGRRHRYRFFTRPQLSVAAAVVSP